jgi:hypothetical protein
MKLMAAVVAAYLTDGSSIVVATSTCKGTVKTFNWTHRVGVCVCQRGGDENLRDGRQPGKSRLA